MALMNNTIASKRGLGAVTGATYNQANRLAAANSTSGGSLRSITYDAFGHRAVNVRRMRL